MRERLTAAFVLLTVTLLVALLLIRSYTLETQLRAHESENVVAQARAMASFLSTSKIQVRIP